MNFSEVKKFMDHLTEWRIPGNDISVWIDNNEVFRYQSGYLDVENKIKMTDNNLINIYSCSKVATAVAGVQMLERNKFTLDTPLYEFIPEFGEMYIKDENANLKKARNSITMRHLFTMTSGMTYSLLDEIREKAHKKTNGLYNTVDVVKLMAKMPLSFEPGLRWQYSFGHDVLAAVIEIVSGKKFRDYMKENIFEPLGMNETCYHADEYVKERMAPQYNFVDDDATSDKPAGYSQSVDLSRNGGHLERKQGNELVFGEEYDSGGAGIITSVSDYVKLVNALANNGLGKTGERILSEDSVNLLKKNQLSDAQKKAFDWPQVKGYGYGLGVKTMLNPSEAGAKSSVGEFGWGGAAGASVYVDTQKRLGVFYAHHMLNPQETYYQPRLRDAIYSCIE